MAETTHRDYNWGIGMKIGDPRQKKPAMWAKNKATNILGYALMKARSKLTEEMKKNVDSKDTSHKISFDDGDQLVQEVKKK